MTTLQPSAVVPFLAQGAQGARRLRESLASKMRLAVSALSARLQRRRAWTVTHQSIDALDAATLRDLGLHRSEAGSVAAELHGMAHPTRQRVLESRVGMRST